MKYRILFASGEAVPFAKVGGLADMISALSKALRKEKQDVRIIIPKHRSVTKFIKEHNIEIQQTHKAFVVINEREFHFKIEEVSYGENQFIFIDFPEFFDRDNPYTNSQTGKDYLDNLMRYIFFDQAVLETCKVLSWIPDIIHAHDWHMGLIPLFQKSIPKYQSIYSNTKTTFTIHNLAYQGVFPVDQYPELGIDWKYFHLKGLEYYRNINFMKAGIVFCDALNTVSPTYAQEIQTKEWGSGLEEVIKEKNKTGIFSGIMNGVDYSEWDPEHDPFIKKKYNINYNHESIEKKYEIQKAFAEEQGLLLKEDTPLIGIITRLYDQKGLDILLECIEDLLKQNIAFTILGTGKSEYEFQLLELAEKYYNNLNVYIGFSVEHSHYIEAASDMFLMPSHFEPCGLNQLYSLRYGTIPIVRKVGGLADSVIDEKTGFVFDNYHPSDLYNTVLRAVNTWRNEKEKWNEIMVRAMKTDFSWNKSAQGYLKLYKQIYKKAPF
ncbi:MAG: glycogen synthase GlgA [Brevinema sp.]